MTELTPAQLAEAIALRDETTSAMENAQPGPVEFRCQVDGCEYTSPSLCGVCPDHQQHVA